jgi:hypothetical protein
VAGTLLVLLRGERRCPVAGHVRVSGFGQLDVSVGSTSARQGVSATVSQAPLALTCAGGAVALLDPAAVQQLPQTLCQDGEDLVDARDGQAATDRYFRYPAKVADLPELL